jgi:DNA-binding MarR family transcriptional regulator
MSRDELMAALNRALRNVSGQAVLFSQALAERLGLSSSDLECLDVIILNGPMTAGDIARASGLTSGAITGVIDRLEKAGYVKRQADPDDRRKVMVAALPSVDHRARSATRPMEDANQALLASYNDKELALILDFMERSHAAALAVTTRVRAETEAVKARGGK